MSAWPCRLCSRRDGGSPGRARVSSGPLVIRLDEERAQASRRATGNEKLGQANLAALLRPSPQASGPPENYVTTTVMADVEPVAKKSKPGPPVAAAAMARVESSVLGPASAGRRDPPGDKTPQTVSPPEIVRDVNVVSDPPSRLARVFTKSTETPLRAARAYGARRDPLHRGARFECDARPRSRRPQQGARRRRARRPGRRRRRTASA